MRPTKKSLEIDSLLTSMSPKRLSRGEALGKGLCTWCGKKVGEFRDSLSTTEYRISGFCQKCQDETWDK